MTTSVETIRRPAVAGTFYSSHPARLRNEIERLLAEAQDAGLPPLRGLIAPHAGYRYSGPVAAVGFRQLQGQPVRRIFLLGPAHYVWVDSIDVAPHAYFETPLGLAPQDKALIDQLGEQKPLYRLRSAAHEPEHCLEVELPFLQSVLADFTFVAMLCGQPDIERAAQDLAQRVQPDDLVVVSSDLSHFHPYEEAQSLDRRFLGHVLAGDLTHAARGEACGLQPILILMRLAQIQGWQPHLLDYRNSGDTGGDPWRVVGYAAVAYTEGVGDR